VEALLQFPARMTKETHPLTAALKEDILYSLLTGRRILTTNNILKAL